MRNDQIVQWKYTKSVNFLSTFQKMLEKFILKPPQFIQKFQITSVLDGSTSVGMPTDR